MFNTLRTLCLGLLTAAALGAAAQGHTLFVAGHLTPCDPSNVGNIVNIQVNGVLSAPVTIATTLNENCYYYVELLVPDTAGMVYVGTSCGNDSLVQASAIYAVNEPFSTDVIVDLSCGNTPPSCDACFTVAQNSVFTGRFTSCSTGASPFTYLWDFSGPGGGAVSGNDISHTFPGAGQYAACLNLTDASGCTSSVCHTVYVDSLGNVGLAPPASCQACFTVGQASSGGQLTPFVADFTNCTSGTGPFAFSWWLPNGSTSNGTNESFTFNGPGVYGVCLTSTDPNACTSTFCDTLVVDANGGIVSTDTWYDCTGVLQGTNIIGAPCDDGDPTTVQDHWDASCNCTGIPCTPLPGTLTLSGGQMMTVCSNDTNWTQAVLSITPAMEPVSYTWTGPGLLPNDTLPTIRPTRAGVFHLSASNACSTSGIDFVLFLNPAPDAGISSTVTVCSTSAPFNLLSALGGTPNAGGTWAGPGTVVVGIYDPATMPPGSYTYTVAGSAPCANATATVTVIIDDDQVWYEDADGDGLGDPAAPITACEQPAGYVSHAGDACPAQWGTVGTPCDDGDPLTQNDTLNANCECIGTPAGTNCQASFTVEQNAPWVITATSTSTGSPAMIFSWSDGSALPHQTFDFSASGTGFHGICLAITDSTGCYSTVCDTIVLDTNGLLVNTPWYDCLQIPNGPNVQGAPCQQNGISGTWSANCTCVPNTTGDCEASFWIMQAYENGDTTGTGTPIANTLWVWNLSSGGTGLYQFLWNFGDSTYSELPFPSHTYAGSGPYILCLTITDSEGCTSTHCDSLYVDDDGLYNGIIGEGGHRSSFTVNVINPLTMGVAENSTMTALSIWPNPAREQLNIALDSELAGALHIEVVDLNGRVVMQQQERIATGSNRILIGTEALQAGMYAVRISNGTTTISRRFVRN